MQKNIKVHLWVKEIRHVVIKCSNWGVQSAECTSHMHAGRLIFHRGGHGNFNVQQEKKRGLFTFMRAHWANKTWRGTCMNYMD